MGESISTKRRSTCRLSNCSPKASRFASPGGASPFFIVSAGQPSPSAPIYGTCSAICSRQTGQPVVLAWRPHRSVSTWQSSSTTASTHTAAATKDSSATPPSR